jgi:hypothetical protein
MIKKEHIAIVLRVYAHAADVNWIFNGRMEYSKTLLFEM